MNSDSAMEPSAADLDVALAMVDGGVAAVEPVHSEADALAVLDRRIGATARQWLFDYDADVHALPDNWARANYVLAQLDRPWRRVCMEMTRAPAEVEFDRVLGLCPLTGDVAALVRHRNGRRVRLAVASVHELVAGRGTWDERAVGVDLAQCRGASVAHGMVAAIVASGRAVAVGAVRGEAPRMVPLPDDFEATAVAVSPVWMVVVCKGGVAMVCMLGGAEPTWTRLELCVRLNGAAAPKGDALLRDDDDAPEPTTVEYRATTVAMDQIDPTVCAVGLFEKGRPACVLHLGLVEGRARALWVDAMTYEPRTLDEAMRLRAPAADVALALARRCAPGQRDYMVMQGGRHVTFRDLEAEADMSAGGAPLRLPSGFWPDVGGTVCVRLGIGKAVAHLREANRLVVFATTGGGEVCSRPLFACDPPRTTGSPVPYASLFAGLGAVHCVLPDGSVVTVRPE